MGLLNRSRLLLQLLVLFLELAEHFLVFTLGVVERLYRLTLVLDEFLVRQQVFLHRLTPLMHLLHCLQLLHHLFILGLQK